MKPELLPKWFADNHDLIGSVLTFLAICVALWQHFRTDYKENKRFERQGRAARVALSLHLSAISQYCTTLLGVIRVPPYTVPPIPGGIVETVKEVILSTSRDDVGERLAALLSHLQLLYSNLILSGEGNDNTSYGPFGMDATRIVILHAIATSLYDFARNPKVEIAMLPITWESIDDSIMSLKLHGNRLVALRIAELIKQYPESPISIYDGL